MTIFALNIMPYISASIIMQLLTSVSPTLEPAEEGGRGRPQEAQPVYPHRHRRSSRPSRPTASPSGWRACRAAPQCIAPGLFFRVTTVVTLTGGTIFLMWLGEQITARGVGNGTSLIIFSGIVANLPSALVRTLRAGPHRRDLDGLSSSLIAGRWRSWSSPSSSSSSAPSAASSCSIPKRQVGNRMFGGETSHLPLKLNSSGVIPPIFASSLLLLPATVGGFAAPSRAAVAADLAALSRPRPAALHAALCRADRLLRLLLHRDRLQSGDTADNLKKYGGFIPGIRPGKNTAEYLDYVLTRLTVLGRGLSVGRLHPAGAADLGILRCRSISAAPAC